MSAKPGHGRLLSLEEWDALPEDDSRQYELVEGVLEVTAKPLPDHQSVMFGLGTQLARQLPTELWVQLDSDVLVQRFPPIVRAPDLFVMPRSLRRQVSHQRFDAADVLLAVEILSPSTERTDKLRKFEEYAEAGIENYWIVDIDAPVSLCSYRLVEREYKLDFEGAGTIALHLPAPVTLDLANLLP